MTTAYCVPNSDINYSWSDDAANDYTRVNDGVRNPASPEISGDGQLCLADGNDDNEEAVFGVTEPISSGTISEITLHAFLATSSDAINVDLRVKLNGTWQTAGTVTATSASGWKTKTYSGSWNAASDVFPMQIGIKPGAIGKSNDLNCFAAYVELTYAEAGGGGTHSRILSNTFGTADVEGGASVGQTILLAMLARRAVASALGLPETLALVCQSVHSRSTSSEFGVSELSALGRTAAVLLFESFGFSDLAMPAFQPVQSRVLGEQIGLMEISDRAAEYQRVVLNSLGSIDDRQLNSSLHRAVDDYIGLASFSTVQLTASRFVLELVGLGEAAVSSILWRLLLSESAGFSELKDRDGILRRQVADAIQSMDSLARGVDAFRALQDLIDVQDEPDRRRVLGNVLPGDAEFVSIGPKDSSFESLGPGDGHLTSLGAGNVSVASKGSND